MGEKVLEPRRQLGLGEGRQRTSGALRGPVSSTQDL